MKEVESAIRVELDPCPGCQERHPVLFLRMRNCRYRGNSHLTYCWSSNHYLLRDLDEEEA